MSPLIAENGLTLAVVLQTCLFLACAMAIFGKAYTFGDIPECNPIFVVSLFHPFPILPTSRRVLLGILGALTITYVGYYAFLVGKAAKQYLIKRLAVFHGTPVSPTPPIVPPDGKIVFDRKFFATVAALLILSILHIVNTELLKFYNEKRTSKVDNSWSFGQVSGVIEFYTLSTFLLIGRSTFRSCPCFWPFTPSGQHLRPFRNRDSSRIQLQVLSGR